MYLQGLLHWRIMIISIKQTWLCLCNWNVMGFTVVWNGKSVGQIQAGAGDRGWPVRIKASTNSPSNNYTVVAGLRPCFKRFWSKIVKALCGFTHYVSYNRRTEIRFEDLRFKHYSLCTLFDTTKRFQVECHFKYTANWKKPFS